MENISSSRYLIRTLGDNQRSSSWLKAVLMDALGAVAEVDHNAKAPEGSVVIALRETPDDAKDGWQRLDELLNEKVRYHYEDQGFAVLPVLPGRFGGESYADGTIVVELQAETRRSQLDEFLNRERLGCVKAREESRRYRVAPEELRSTYLPDVLERLRTHDELFSRVYLNADLVATRAAR